MFTLKLLKGVTLDRRNASKRLRALGKEGGKQDGTLPDADVFEIARTDGMRAYNEAKGEDLTIIVLSERFPEYGFVRGTDSLTDWRGNIVMGATNYKIERFTKYIRQIEEFLRENPNVHTLIGHSLGYGLVLRVIEQEEFSDINVIGLDGAAILGDDPVLSVKSRNINTDSVADSKILDPWGPVEMSHDAKKYFNSKLAASDRAGHQAWEASYKKKFRGDPSREKEKSTGYYHGKVMYPEDYIGKVQHA